MDQALFCALWCTVLIPLMLPRALRDCLTDEETEAQSGSRGRQVVQYIVELEFTPRFQFQYLCLQPLNYLASRLQKRRSISVLLVLKSEKAEDCKELNAKFWE